MKGQLYQSYINKKFVKKYYRQQCANELDNIEEMEKFLYTNDWNQLKTLSRSITNKVIELAIKQFPTKKCPGPHMFTDEFYQMRKEEPVLPKTLLKYKKGGNLPNSFYETKIILIPKSTKTFWGWRKKYRTMSLLNVHTKILANTIWQHLKKITYHD